MPKPEKVELNADKQALEKMDETYNPDAFNFIDLFTEVGRLMAHNYDSRSGLSRVQTGVIVTLLKSDGLTQTELANALNIHKVSAGIYISELEELGLVERRAHPQDGRAKCIFLTDLLHQLRGGGESIVNDLHKRILAGIDGEDYERLLSYMHKMKFNLEEMASEIVPKPDESN
jgi:MarR family transcriptional regulator, transcriptional regulator for hemolysin